MKDSHFFGRISAMQKLKQIMCFSLRRRMQYHLHELPLAEACVHPQICENYDILYFSMFVEPIIEKDAPVIIAKRRDILSSTLFF